MSVGRNAPCPCGSGRKYKHCCYAKDAMSEAGERGTMRLPPHVQAQARSTAMWEADIVAIPGVCPDREDRRPLVTLVTAGDVAVHSDVWEGASAEAPEIADVLHRAVSAAATAVGQWPESLLVRHEMVARFVRERLAPHDCEVLFGTPLPYLDVMSRALIERLTGEPIWPPASTPASWSAWGLPEADVARLFSAYADLYRAAPWRWIDAMPPLVAIWDDGADDWTVTVTGRASRGEVGVTIFGDVDDLRAAVEAGDPAEAFGVVSGWVITVAFLSASELPAFARREISRAGWEVASADAYPWLLPILTPGGGISRDMAWRLASFLRALAALAVEEGSLLSDASISLSREGEGLRLWRGPSHDDWWGDPEEADFDEDDGPEGPGDRDEADPAASDEEAVHPVTGEILDDVGAQQFGSLDEARAWIAERIETRNRTPRADLSGISPDQALALLEGDWKDHGPLRLAEDLALAELSAVPLLDQARAVLTALVEADGAQATPAGNLRRAFVSEVVERIHFTEEDREAIRGRGPHVNEQDIWPIHRARVLLELAGLVRRRRNRFVVTRLGRELAGEERAGRLFAQLFRTYFRTFNLAYGGFGPEAPALQRMAPLLIWRTGVEARDWIHPKALGERILHEELRADPEDPPGHPRGVLRFRGRILRPLINFGLLEEHGTTRGVGHGDEQRREVRVTPLFDHFLRFDWG